MAGVRETYGRSPLTVAMEMVTDPSEQRRRNAIRRRVDLYCGDVARVLREEFSRTFPRERAREYDAWLSLGSALAFFRRTVDRLARPVYAPPPLRTVYQRGKDPGRRRYRRPGPGQEPWNNLAKQSRYNARMRLTCGLSTGITKAALHHRINPRLGLVTDVIAGNAMTPIPDIDDATREIAVVYDEPVYTPGGQRELWYVYWDPDEAFVFDQAGRMRTIRDAFGGQTRILNKSNGHPGILPFVVVNSDELFGADGNTSHNSDMEQGASAAGLIGTMMLRLLKSQGHKQLGANGVVGAMAQADIQPQGQVLDPESPVLFTDGSQLSVLYNETPVTHFTDALKAFGDSVDRNHGLDEAGQVDLLERRADVVARFDEVEQRSFEVIKVVSQQHPEWRLPEDAALACDFAEVSAKADRKTVLENWQTEIKMGLRNVLDCIREDQPECTTEEDALAELLHNEEMTAIAVQLAKDYGIRTDANLEEPGLTQEQNGAMGPPVRDGMMSRDEAAARAGALMRQIRQKRQAEPAAE